MTEQETTTDLLDETGRDGGFWQQNAESRKSPTRLYQQP
jgi:hypothetical protein